MDHKTRFFIQSAVIAALYVILTLVSNALGLANGIIQVRLSEALTILPVFSISAVPGLFIGCFLSNLLTGCALWDMVFGAIATLIGAMGTRWLRKKKGLRFIPPILSNTLIIPLVLSFVYQFEGSLWYFMITVGIGEIIACGLGGILLLKLLERSGDQIPWV